MPNDPLPKVAATLRDPHPLVAETVRQIRAETEANDRFPHSSRRGVAFSVSTGTLARAARIADALFQHLEHLGHRVRLRDDQRDGITVTIEAQAIDVRLRESFRERVVQDRYGERRVYQPTGQLEAVIDEYLDLARKRWVDGKRRGPLENQLPALVAGLETAAQAKRQDHAAREAEARAREAARERYEQARAQQEEEKRRSDALEREAAAWQRSQVLREYLDAVESSAVQASGAIDPAGPLAAWLAWGRRYIERLDPLPARCR